AMSAYQYLLKSFQARSKDDAPNRDLARVMKKIGKVLAKRGEQDAALSYYQNALDQFEKLGETLEVAELLNRSAWLHREKDDYEGARSIARRAPALLDGSGPNIVYGYATNVLGSIESNLASSDKAKDLVMKTLEIGDKLCSGQ